MAFPSRCTIMFALLLAGCGTSFQGIKMRAQGPPIDEAFRNISLAISTDGYNTETIMPSKCSLVTKWREMTAQETAKSEAIPGVSRTEYRLALRMEPRGKLYDMFLSPLLRYTLQDGTTREETASALHPLSKKWERVTRQLLEIEQRDED